MKVQTGDGVVAVPGQDEAREQEKAQAEEREAVSLFAPSANLEADYGPDYGYNRIRLHKGSEVNPYAEARDARTALDGRLRSVIILAVAVLLVFVFAAVMPTNIFSPTRADRSLSTLATEVAQSFQYLVALFMGTSGFYSSYVLEIVATLLAGAALGVCGGVYQGAMKNALASPSTLGVTSGGMLGVIIYVLFIFPSLTVNGTMTVSEYAAALEALPPLEYLLHTWGEFIASMVGCFTIVGLIMLIAFVAGRGKVSNVALVVAGQVFTAVIGVVLTWVRYYYEVMGDPVTATLVSSLQYASFAGPYTALSMAVFAVPLLLCLVVVFALSGRLSLLAFNDEEARSMGISTTRIRNLMVGVCTLATALVISFCGPIGFVGFMVPHVARKVVGPDFRYLLPACALLGAILVALAHCVTMLGIPVIVAGSTGMVTSIIGSALFVIMALRSRGVTSGDWL